MADDRSFRNWAGRGLAAAAICAGLSLSPLPALAEEAASAQPDAPVAATTEAAPAAVTEAAPVPAAEPAPVATAQASATPAEELKSAQSAQATAQDAVTNAQNDVSQKTALKNAADENVSEAQNTQADVTQSEQRKDAAATEAEEKDTAAKNAEDEANQAKDVSDAELQAARDAENKATNDLLHAQLTQGAVNQKAESAKAEKDAADKAASTAKSDLETKQQNVVSAQKTYDEANKALSDAKSAAAASQQAEINRTKKALDDANKALTEAAANKESATTAYQQAQKSVEDAKSALATLQAELRQAELDYTIAQRRETALKNISEGKTGSTIIINDGDKITRSDQLAIDQAQAESYMYNCRDDVERAKKNLTAAQATLDEAKKALEIAKQPISVDVSQGSLGFFKWLTSLDADNQDAIDVLTDSSITGTDIKTNKPFINMTHIGAKDDSTSLENVKRALEYIKQCNDIRAKDPENPGLKALKINTFLMGLAEVNANWTMSNSLTATGAHAIFSGENSYAGENAAGSYNMPWYDPFEAWYTDERIDFLNHTPNAETGHYKAIVDAENEETGFGVNTNTFGADPLDQRFIQEFCSSRNSTRGVTYTYDEFMALFNAYYAAATKSSNATVTARLIKVVEDRLSVAQNAYDGAEDALAIAEDDYAVAQQDFKEARQAVLDYHKGKKDVKTAAERAKAKLDSAHQETVAAQNKVTSCKAKVTQAQKTLDAANKALADAKSAKDTAEARYQKKADLVKVAQDAYDIAKSGTSDARVQQAQQRVTTAQKNLTAAKQAAAAAQTTYDRAVSRASTAEKNLQTAESDLASAQAACKKAEEDLMDAHWAFIKVDDVRRQKNALVARAKQARAEATAAKEAYETTVEQWKTATARAKEAQANLSKLRQRASDAADALRAAEARLGTAQSDLDAANKRLSAARAAWQRATAVQTMYRLYNPNSGEHFYTANARERDSVVRAGWNYEGVGWTAPVHSNTPVYRLYSGTDHHYTMSAGERDDLVRAGWKYEGIGWYSDDAKGVPLYRQFNPNVEPSAPRNNSGSHNYTTSKPENDRLVALGWRAEGIGWYGVDVSKLREPAAPKPKAARETYYAIRYDGNGGTGAMSAQAVRVDVSVGLWGSSFSRSGYTFAGWSRTATGSVAYGDRATVRNLSTRDGGVVALYAVWNPIVRTYTVRYDGNGATSGSTASQTMMRDQYASLATNGYSKTGYTFSKWSTAKTGSGTQYSQGQSVTNLAPAGSTATLYARWNPNTYSVCYMPSGSEGELSVQSFTYDQEGYLRSTEFSRTGYRCAGWATYEGGSKAYELGQRVKNLTANPNGCIYLYPAWEPITYYVQFQGNGYTSGSMSREQFTYDQYKNLTSNAYSRTGYKFTGWKDSSASSSYTDGQRVGNLSDTENDTIYLYAQWTPITYYVQFNGNGYTSGSMNSQAFTYDKGQSLTSNSYSRTGYTFAGWKDTDHGKSYSNGQYVSNLSSVENGSVTLNAQWAPISYTVRFNNNGGMNEMASVSMTYDQSTTLKKSPFVREGYSFAGWATSASGSARYSDGASVGNLTSTNGGTVTLYAVWTKRPDGRLIEDGTYLIHSYDPAHVDVAVGVDAKDNGTSVKLQAWYALDNDNAGTASEAAKKQSWTFEWDSKLGGYKITNEWSGKVLEIKNEGDSLNQDGTIAQIWDDDGTSLCKRWYLRRNSNGLQLINCASLRALDMRQEDGYVAGARVEQWAAEINNPQQTYELTLLSVPAGTTKIQNFETGTYVIELSADSSKCLELPADNLGDGAPVQAGTYTGASNQKWEITKNDDGTYKITNVASKAAGNLESFDNTGWALKSGTKLEVWESSGNQRPVKWIIQKNSDGTYSFTSAFSRLAVSLPQEGGTQLELRPISTGTNVRFKLVKC